LELEEVKTLWRTQELMTMEKIKEIKGQYETIIESMSQLYEEEIKKEREIRDLTVKEYKLRMTKLEEEVEFLTKELMAQSELNKDEENTE
jgi:hypothetical protein